MRLDMCADMCQGMCGERGAEPRHRHGRRHMHRRAQRHMYRRASTCIDVHKHVDRHVYGHDFRHVPMPPSPAAIYCRTGVRYLLVMHFYLHLNVYYCFVTSCVTMNTRLCMHGRVPQIVRWLRALDRGRKHRSRPPSRPHRRLQARHPPRARSKDRARPTLKGRTGRRDISVSIFGDFSGHAPFRCYPPIRSSPRRSPSACPEKLPKIDTMSLARVGRGAGIHPRCCFPGESAGQEGSQGC